MKDDTGRRSQCALNDEEEIIRILGTDVGLSRDEAVYYLKLIGNGSAEASTEREFAERLTRRGMAIWQGTTRESRPFIPG